MKIPHFTIKDVTMVPEGNTTRHGAKEEYHVGKVLIGYRDEQRKLHFVQGIPQEARLDLMDVLDCLGIVHL